MRVGRQSKPRDAKNLSVKILKGTAILFSFVTLVVSLSFPGGNRIYFYLFTFALFYWQSKRLQKFTGRVEGVRMKTLVFLLTSWAGAIFLEFSLVHLPFSPKPAADIFLGVGYYLPYFAIWYVLLRRYRFNFLEIFYLAGFGKLTFDLLITRKLLIAASVATTILSSWLIFISQALITLVLFGMLTTLPALFLPLGENNHNKPARQYLIGLTPSFLAAAVFVIWTIILKAIFT
jgi:hypothetical protein